MFVINNNQTAYTIHVRRVCEALPRRPIIFAHGPPGSLGPSSRLQERHSICSGTLSGDLYSAVGLKPCQVAQRTLAGVGLGIWSKGDTVAGH
jgi:hypothetical protein